MKIRCHNCQYEYEDFTTEKEVPININGKQIIVTGVMHECPKCGDKWTTEEESKEFIKKYEEALKEPENENPDNR